MCSFCHSHSCATSYDVWRGWWWGRWRGAAWRNGRRYCVEHVVVDEPGGGAAGWRALGGHHRLGRLDVWTRGACHVTKRTGMQKRVPAPQNQNKLALDRIVNIGEVNVQSKARRVTCRHTSPWAAPPTVQAPRRYK